MAARYRVSRLTRHNKVEAVTKGQLTQTTGHDHGQHLRNDRRQHPHSTLQRIDPLNCLKPRGQIVRCNEKPAHLHKCKHAGKHHRPPQYHVPGDHGSVAPAPLPRHKEQQRDARAYEQADHGGSVPDAILAARLQGKEKHEDTGDEDETANQVEVPDSFPNARPTIPRGVEEE